METVATSGLPSGMRERRHSPRLRADAALRASLRHLGLPVPVRDVSLGGFAVEAPAPLVIGTMHHCELMPVNGPSETLLAQVVRSDRAPGTSHFVTGFRFSMVEPDCRQRLTHLIDAITGAH